MNTTGRTAAWAVILIVVTAGCSAPLSGAGTQTAAVDAETPTPATDTANRVGESTAPTGTESPTPTPDAETASADTATPTPSDSENGTDGSATVSGEIVVRVGSENDTTVGWEAGYWHNDSIDVTLDDGLSSEEWEPYLARSMARVEYLRGHEFTRPIAIEVITREQVRQKVEETGSFLSNRKLTPRQIRIMNVFWEALFFVGEDEDVRVVRASEQSSFLGAYYLFQTDRIKVVTATPDRLVIRERLLIHDLVHALQDEYGNTPLGTRSDDDNYATSALIEGDATVVEYRYSERCESGAWECVSPPSSDSDGSSGSSDVHVGFRVLRQFAYSDGPSFVQYLYEHGHGDADGWDAVDRAFAVRPRTTEEIIHPERYPANDTPTPSTSTTPRDGWERIGGPYQVGEVEIFAMFWYQDAGYDIRVIDTDSITDPDGGRYDRLNYTSVSSEGWNGDGLEIYANGNETGYVWITTWDTHRDATEFHRAYLELLAGHGARQVGDGTWVVPEGEYADAFAVRLDGQDVIVVNGPSEEDLPDIYPPSEQ